ncbi:MAG TPA: GNAT family N-acetyltransferase [Rhizomicrobium sp.]|jgi:GNAT superfamily N-acetyltransferase
MPNRPIDIRAYGGRRDLDLLLEFASRCFAERFPLSACWHPGDFVWELKPHFDRPHRIRIWLSPDGVEAAAMFTAADRLWLEIRPACEDLLPQIVAKAEGSRLRGTEEGTPATLSIRAFEADTRRIAALEALGYRPGEPDHVWFRLDLSQPLPEFPSPPGFRIRDCVGIDPQARAAVHRVAWSDLSQIGIENARSGFNEDIYLGLARAPVYDPALDIVVQAPDGTFVANTICWADTASGVGIFEPVGSDPAYRRRGLARLAMLEGLRRLQARGMRWAGVGTAHFNAPAIATYSSFFQPLDRTRWWTKTLA